MSTHNICFHQEIRKILCGYPLLSVVMASGLGLHCLQRSICPSSLGYYVNSYTNSTRWAIFSRKERFSDIMYIVS